MKDYTLPEDFDWEFYLNNYSDLINAGLKSEKEAKRHYLNHGISENRVYKKELKEEKLIIKDENLWESFIKICKDLIPYLPNEFPIINKNSYKKSLIVETRKLEHNEFVIKNTIQKLGNDWGHIIYCHDNNYEQIKLICNDISSDIEIRLLEKDIDRNNYNNLLLDINFWNKIDCEKVLIYQTDSFISKDFDDSFLEYDYIGGLWEDNFFVNFLSKNLNLDSNLKIGNGGLSIRDVKKTKNCLQDEKFLDKYKKLNLNETLDYLPEDILFSSYFFNKKIPSLEISKYFSSESYFNKNSFGYHKPWSYMSYYEMIKKFKIIKPKITIHQLCYNEIEILEFSYNFYKSRFPGAKFILHDNQSTDGSKELALKLGYEVKTFNTNNQMDEMTQTNLRNSCWKNDDADWIIVCDMDELIDINEQDLINEEISNNTIIRTEGYHMINLKNNKGLNDMEYGFSDSEYDKCLIFKKSHISEMEWAVGSHSCKPKGSLINYTQKKYNLLHYKFISEDYVINRYKNLFERQSEKNIKNNWCYNYKLKEDEIRKVYKESLEKPLKKLINSNTSKNICFTISTYDRMSQSKVLGDSFLKHNPNYEFIIVIVDDIDGNIDTGYQTIFAKDIFVPGFKDKFERYTKGEICFTMKPFAFLHIFNYLNVDKVIYLDNDILVLNEFTEVDNSLIEYDILLTPHICKKIFEYDFILTTGLFNAGFLAIKNSENSFNFLKWWSKRLEQKCEKSFDKGLFYDQKWLDLSIVLFQNVKIIKNEGYNVAYWNLEERNLKNINGCYKVNDKDLVFYHFAGFEFDDKITKYGNKLSDNLKESVRDIFNIYTQLVSNEKKII